jgi:hypothetical protein
VGAHRRWHAEWYYLGNPGDYQYFHLAVVDAAPTTEDANSASDVIINRASSKEGVDWTSDQADDDALTTYRAATVPNTYGETQALGVDDPFPIGVDDHWIRVLRR